MVLLEQLSPPPIAQLGRPCGRADDVGEEDRRKDPLRLRVLPAARIPHLREETTDLRRDRCCGTTGGQVTPRDLDEAGSGDAIGQVLGHVQRNHRVVGAVEEQPAASITARTSSMRVSSVGAPVTRSDIPVPRLSNRISREKEASSVRNGAKEGRVQTSSTWVRKGGMNTKSKRPSPRT
jgi:hypothetical protein